MAVEGEHNIHEPNVQRLKHRQPDHIGNLRPDLLLVPADFLNDQKHLPTKAAGRAARQPLHPLAQKHLLLRCRNHRGDHERSARRPDLSLGVLKKRLSVHHLYADSHNILRLAFLCRRFLEVHFRCETADQQLFELQGIRQVNNEETILSGGIAKAQ